MNREAAETIPDVHRAYADWASPKGLNTDILPWKLWERAKKLYWDPADIDFSKDAEQWALMTVEQRIGIAGLARGFMVGEEGVTLDILPLILAVSDEGRVEETMYLTSFAFEEAKHVDFFRRWFTAVGCDLDEIDDIVRERQIARGVTPPDPNQPREGLFEKEVPRVMRRLVTDRSPEAFLDAAVTYNQFVEGCLAIAGYHTWERLFANFGALPGMQEGLRWIQRDERRHIAYGTYVVRRIIAAHPELFEFARRRMYELRDGYDLTAVDPDDPDAVRSIDGVEPDEAIQTNVLEPFIRRARAQVERRIEVMSKARTISVREAELGEGSEEDAPDDEGASGAPDHEEAPDASDDEAA